ncbi:2TM domain-containing protein [Oscillatoria sp. CS-180]|uniref:2TM domain-containing protein n=1 Tax=Oscillatoria sp. CS-180 TaxID=3021720 RepID=UPI00232B85B0|nr:2TM domain-containing protein [Oscillatoria sp. CS-180]MDB9529187.1 2TM domain-containing protein [Oscillatoria sp. CS-180]
MANPSQQTLPQSVPLARSQQYSPEAVQGILSKALELRSQEKYSAQQLAEMATELNVTPELLKQAEADWRSQQIETASRQAKSAERQRNRRDSWLKYLAGSALLVGINVATAGTVTWAVFPVMGWGLGVVFGDCDQPCSKSHSSKSHKKPS